MNTVIQSKSARETSPHCEHIKRGATMPNVFVVPVYVEVPGGFERSVMALESHLRRAGYIFHIGNPLFETLEETKRALARTEELDDSAHEEGGPESAAIPELAESNKA
jgi:hypothetical protein